MRTFLKRTTKPLGSFISHLSQVEILPLRVARLIPHDWVLDVFPVLLPEHHTILYSGRPNDPLQIELFKYGIRKWERGTLTILPDLIRNSRHFVDVGAYTGFYTLFACSLNPTITATAIEPNDTTFTALQRNVQLNRFNSRCALLNDAATSSECTLHLNHTMDPSMCHVSNRSATATDVVVAGRPLDRMCAQGHPDLVKIDAEGHEYEVLLGMTDILSHTHPSLILELNPGAHISCIQRFLDTFDYRYWSLSGSRPVKHTTLRSFGPGTNWLCISKHCDCPLLS